MKLFKSCLITTMIYVFILGKFYLRKTKLREFTLRECYGFAGILLARLHTSQL